MAGYPRDRDIVDRIRDLERRVKRLELVDPGKQTENFILDPVTVRPLPGVPAPPRGQIVAVWAKLGAGGPITVAMKVVTPAGVATIHTFTALAGDGVKVYHEFGNAEDDQPVDLEHGDEFYPEIVSGEGRDLTATFVMAP